jgi:adenylate cyclase
VCEVAKKLGVSHVLEGSVRKAGTRLRITAQLIDGATGDHVWAQRFDRDLTDIFAIQDEISKAIVEALKVKLLPDEKKAMENRGTTNVEAYDFYLMAREYWVSGTEGDPRRYEIILRYCNTAVGIDPGYARAWALIALTQSDMHRKDVAIEETGLAAAEKALALDPSLAEPHCVIADFLAKQGRFAEADRETEIALSLDPDSWEVNREAALISYRQGRFAESIQRFEKAASLMDNDYRSASMLLSGARAVGDSKTAERAARMVVERAERLFAVDRSNGSALAYGATGLAYLGELDRAKEWIRRAMLIDPWNAIMRYNLACVVTHDLRDLDLALDLVTQWMDKANAYQIKHVENDPDLAELRQDPRFQAMIASAKERLGIATKAAPATPAAETAEPPRS